MPTEIYVNGNTSDRLIENLCDWYTQDDVDTKTGTDLALCTLPKMNYNTDGVARYFIEPNSSETLKGIWANESISTKLFCYKTALQDYEEIKLAAKGTAPLPNRPSSKSSAEWGLLNSYGNPVANYTGPSTFWLRYNASNIERSTTSATSGFSTLISNRKVIFMDICAGGGGGGGGCWIFPIGYYAGCGGGGGATAFLCVDLSKSGVIKVEVGAGGKKGSGNMGNDNYGKSGGRSVVTINSKELILYGGSGGGADGDNTKGGGGTISGDFSGVNGVYIIDKKPGKAGGWRQESGESFPDSEQIIGIVGIDIPVKVTDRRGCGSPPSPSFHNNGGGSGASALGCKIISGIITTGSGYGYGGLGGGATNYDCEPGEDGQVGVCIIH